MEAVLGEGTAVAVRVPMDAVARADLRRAMARLQEPGGLLMRGAGMLSSALGGALGGVMGSPMRMGARLLDSLPGGRAAVQGVVEVALRRAFDVAVLRLGGAGEQERSRRFAGPLVVLSGAVGGFVGVGGFVPDVAVTTLAIMREIARIAVESGESLDDPQTRAACLEVFALHPGSAAAGDAEMGYFGARMVLQGRPLAFLLAEVAGRFGLTLSQKLAAGAVPVVGAIGGAAVNSAFLSQFRSLAQAHFTVRRLERQFGADVVREAADAQP